MIFENTLYNGIWGIKARAAPRRKTVYVVHSGDDGYSTDYQLAQLAASYGIPYTFAIEANNIGKTGRLTNDEIAEIINMGHHIGVHGLTDFYMTDKSEQELENIYEGWYDALGVNKQYTPIIYNHGTVVNSYIESVIKYYGIFGVTMTRGTDNLYRLGDNNVRFRMHRNGLFPSTGDMGYDEVVQLIENANDGDIISFATHSNTSYYSLEELARIFEYETNNPEVRVVSYDELNALCTQPYIVPDKPTPVGWMEVPTEDRYLNSPSSSAVRSCGIKKTDGSITVFGTANNQRLVAIAVEPGERYRLEGWTLGIYSKYGLAYGAVYNASVNPKPSTWHSLVSFDAEPAGTAGNFADETIEIPEDVHALFVSGFNPDDSQSNTRHPVKIEVDLSTYTGHDFNPLAGVILASTEERNVM